MHFERDAALDQRGDELCETITSRGGFNGV
jgi:hypothetical protein